MVNSVKIEKKLDELSIFFASIIESAVNNVDAEAATYGFEKVNTIKRILDKYKKAPKNHYLKQIHSSFFSVTRGVEAFTDSKANNRFNEKCQGIYEIIKELEAQIKW